MIPENIQQAGQKARELAGVSGQAKAAEPTISDTLRQKVQEAYSQNQDIVGPLDTATSQYLTAPQVAREKYQDVFNPFTREKLVSQYISSQSLPMLALANIYGNRVGRIEDTIGAGTRAYQADVAAKVAQTDQARQAYQDLLNEYVTTEELKQKAKSSSSPDLSSFITALASVFNPQKNSDWEVVDDPYKGTQSIPANQPAPMSVPNQNPPMSVPGQQSSSSALSPYLNPLQEKPASRLLQPFNYYYGK